MPAPIVALWTACRLSARGGRAVNRDRRTRLGAVNPYDVVLPAPLARRLAERADELLALGTVLEDRHAADDAERDAMAELARRLRNTYPYPDAHYAGQMLKPPAAIAWAAYATAMLLNPNNHALDGGPATAAMEKEAVAALARMFGLDRHLGHLTASGTIANLEALWVARELHPDRAIVSGENAHYTHARVSAVLGARHETLPENAHGRLDLDALEGPPRRGVGGPPRRGGRGRVRAAGGGGGVGPPRRPGADRRPVPPPRPPTPRG